MKKLVVLVIIIAIFVSLGGYGILFLNNKIVGNKKNENQNIVQNEVKNEPQVKELDINSNLVKDLYKYILTMNVSTEETVYQNKKVNVNHLSNIITTLTVFNNIDLEKDCYKKEYNDNFSHDEYCEYYFTKDFVDKKFKSIFGDSAILNPLKEINLLGTKINFKNNEFIFTKFPGGGGIPWFSTSKLVKAEEFKDNIYLYDKYIHIVQNYGTNENNGSVKCYNASDRQKLLIEQNDVEPEMTIDNIENVDTFKHTFAKKDDGSYYWVSTEIVK